MLVTKITYKIVNGEIVVCIYGRGEDGRRYEKPLLGTLPYFYCSELPSDMKYVRKVKKNAGTTLDGERVHKIFTRYPSDVPEVRSQFDIYDTYEANVLYNRRIRYDLRIRSGIEFSDDAERSLYPEDITPSDVSIVPRYWIIDIETDDSGEEFADAMHPSAEVVSISIYDNYSDSFYGIINCRGNIDAMRQKVDAEEIMSWFKTEYDESRNITILYAFDEKTLFDTFDSLLVNNNIDLISGWYVKDFDLSYLAQRAMRRKYKFPEWKSKGGFGLEKYVIVDCFEAYKKIRLKRLVSYSLEYVSQTELGVGKVERRSIHHMYENSPDLLMKYNIQDVRLVDLLNQKKKIFRYFLNLSKLAGCEMPDVFHNSWVVDSYILHELNGKYVAPTKARPIIE